MGGEYEALDLDTKYAIDIVTRPTFKIHERGEGDVKLGRHRFVTKVRTEERMMDFLKRFVGRK